MIQLQRLTLRSNKLRNICFLGKLINLELVDLSQNDNLDVSPIQYLTSLTYLDISSCKISDISSLKALVKLEVLYLQSNKIHNIQHLQNLVKLTDFDISYNCVQDISILKMFKCLKRLCLSDNKGIDITPLQYLEQLTYLTATACGLFEISVLRQLVNLEKLDLSWNNIFYFYPIGDLDVDITVYGNFIVESSDLFTIFDIQDKSVYISEQPTNQQFQLAGIMKTVDQSRQYIRDINTRRINYLQKKQIVKDTLVSLQERLYEKMLSLSNNAVQLFLQLNEQECQ
ncbi:leucine-rich_repeat domain-containing protein [Hexamita inflata]|uniref:Leucine-rich_repeat domain-containing protein n=1 Tax=Hexamita inflata TaxID=28002 RepID=A0ABP1GSV7_9EUKA